MRAILLCCNQQAQQEEWERQEKEKDKEWERERERKRQEEKEKDRKVELAKLELERRSQELKRAFDVNKNLSMVPKFDTTQIDAYFEAFEKKAMQLKWPQEHWVTMMTTNLTDKAQEVYVGMKTEDGDREYDKVKSAILKAYDRLPEAYRQTFREDKPSVDQTWTDFARQQQRSFEKWLRASEVCEFGQLQELVRLVQFKNSLPATIQVHINYAGVTSVSKAAEMADNYMLVHKGDVTLKSELQEKAAQCKQPGEEGQLGEKPWHPSTNNWIRVGGRPESHPKYDGPKRESWPDSNRKNWRSNRDNWRQRDQRQNRSSSLPFLNIICHNCGEAGHLQSNCRKREPRPAESPHPSACMSVKPIGESEVVRKADGQKVFNGFESEGTVALEEEGPEVNLSVVRDTCS